MSILPVNGEETNRGIEGIIFFFENFITIHSVLILCDFGLNVP